MSRSPVVRVPRSSIPFVLVPAAGGQRSPVLVLAGDAFSDSTLDGCIQSAKRAVELLELEGQ